MRSIIFCLALSFSALAGDDFSKEVIKPTQLTPSMYQLEGAGGNMTASIGPDGVFLVDDDFAPMAEKLVNKLKELGGSAPRFIVNTHFHYDHTEGNKIFGPSATIIAATQLRERLMHEQVLWKETHPPFPPKALPTVTFEKELTLHVNGEDIRILHLPSGHTDGDTVVFFPKSKVVAMGDLYFAGMYPIFHPEHQGSLIGYVRNLEKILLMIPEGTQLVAGHGPLSGKVDLERYIRMVRAVMATVRRGIRSGLTLEQIQKNGLAPEWEPYSHGYVKTEVFLERVYKELSNTNTTQP